jgi:hypothetical protein
LPGGKLIDRIQNIAGNVLDLNIRRLSQWINRSGIPTTFCPEIKLSPPFRAASVVMLIFILSVFLISF